MYYDQGELPVNVKIFLQFVADLYGKVPAYMYPPLPTTLCLLLRIGRVEPFVLRGHGLHRTSAIYFFTKFNEMC
jgi:hypothetical protein